MDEKNQQTLKSKLSGSMQEVIFPDFPDDDNTVTTTVTKSRRVSFGTNFVKEFIIGSAVSAQCVSEYEQAFSSSDSSNANSSHSGVESGILSQNTYVLEESHKLNQMNAPDSEEKTVKRPKISSTICFSVDSPTADMEFTEGCISLAKSILEKKNKEMTVIIQAKPKESKSESKINKNEETKYFEDSQFDISMTKCFKSKENKKAEKRFEEEKTRFFNRYDDEISFTRCDEHFRIKQPKVSNDDEEASWDEDDCKENQMPLDMIMSYLDNDNTDVGKSLFNPEKSLSEVLNANPVDIAIDSKLMCYLDNDNTDVDKSLFNPKKSLNEVLNANPIDISIESEKSNLNESMDISKDFQPNFLRIPVSVSSNLKNSDDESKSPKISTTDEFDEQFFQCNKEIISQEAGLAYEKISVEKGDSFLETLSTGVNMVVQKEIFEDEMKITFAENENVNSDITLSNIIRSSEEMEVDMEEKTEELKQKLLSGDNIKESEQREVPNTVEDKTLNNHSINMEKEPLQNNFEGKEKENRNKIEKSLLADLSKNKEQKEIEDQEQLTEVGKVVEGIIEDILNGTENIIESVEKNKLTNNGIMMQDLVDKLPNKEKELERHLMDTESLAAVDSSNKKSTINYFMNEKTKKDQLICKENLIADQLNSIEKIVDDKAKDSENVLKDKIIKNTAKIDQINEIEKAVQIESSIEDKENLTKEKIIEKITEDQIMETENIEENVEEDQIKAKKNQIMELEEQEKYVLQDKLKESEIIVKDKVIEAAAEYQTINGDEIATSQVMSVEYAVEIENNIKDKESTRKKTIEEVTEDETVNIRKLVVEQIMEVEDIIKDKEVVEEKLTEQAINDQVMEVEDIIKDKEVVEEKLTEQAINDQVMNIEKIIVDEVMEVEKSVETETNINDKQELQKKNISEQIIGHHTIMEVEGIIKNKGEVVEEKQTEQAINDQIMNVEKIIVDQVMEVEKSGETVTNINDKQELQKKNTGEQIIEHQTINIAETVVDHIMEVDEIDKSVTDSHIMGTEKEVENVKKDQIIDMKKAEKNVEENQLLNSVNNELKNRIPSKVQNRESLLEAPGEDIKCTEKVPLKSQLIDKSKEIDEFSRSQLEILQKVEETPKDNESLTIQKSILENEIRVDNKMDEDFIKDQCTENLISISVEKSNVSDGMVVENIIQKEKSFTFDDSLKLKESEELFNNLEQKKIQEFSFNKALEKFNNKEEEKSFNENLRSTPLKANINQTEIKPSLVDSKVVENLREQSKEPGCVWTLKDLNYSQGLLSFNFVFLDSSVTIQFSLQSSEEDALDSCCSIANSKIYMNEEEQFRLKEYKLVIDFGFEKVKKYFEENQKTVKIIRHVPYFLDQMNSFIAKINICLRQVYSILTLYPGSSLKGNSLSFRLFSFPVFFSSTISIELSNWCRLSKSSLSFEIHFGSFNKNKIMDIFQESLKCENSLCEFVIRATKYLIDLERESGYISKRQHITLLPKEFHM